MQHTGPASILVIDEVPLIATGIRSVFLPSDGTLVVEQTSSVYSALSRQAYDGASFGLVVIDPAGSSPDGSLRQLLFEIKHRFPTSAILIYTAAYSPEIIGQTEGTGTPGPIACVHKHEAAGELLTAWSSLSNGIHYISPIFQTLYFQYRLGLQ